MTYELADVAGKLYTIQVGSIALMNLSNTKLFIRRHGSEEIFAITFESPEVGREHFSKLAKLMKKVK